jgi:REP element-mobilizing transposase RayT
MPDHAHWLMQLGENDPLSPVVNRFKSASSRLVNRELARQGSLWEQAYHDRALRSEENLWDVTRYVISNPIRVGLVHQVEDYTILECVWL